MVNIACAGLIRGLNRDNQAEVKATVFVRRMGLFLIEVTPIISSAGHPEGYPAWQTRDAER